MSRWVVVTTALKVAVAFVVDRVIERTELEDGHVRWLVACPYGAQELIRLVPGVISVDPAQPATDIEDLPQAA